MQAVTDAATQLSGAQFGAFFYNVTDEHGESYMLYTLSGAPREAFEKFGQPRATAALRPDVPRRGADPLRRRHSADPRYGKMAPHHGMPPGHLPVRSYLAVPVISRSGEVIGGLFFGHPEPGVFTERAERSSSASPRRPRSRSTTPGCTRRRSSAAEERKRCSKASAPRAPRPSA